jgi:3-oxoacyl-[acyl-carrier-protein] synthase II
MTIFIRATANISPQQTFGAVPFLTEPVEYTDNVLKAIEPDYTTIIDPKLIRRMSHIIRMGVAAASECLKDADENNPDAIITATNYGCLEDTGIFLSRIIEQNEEMLSPTAFIQSTHNTVGAQIALMLKCHAYNNTFVHNGFSFESALLDGIMLLQENEATNVLACSIDEITTISYGILKRFGLYKRVPVSNLELFSSKTKGTIAGEGAACFLLASEPAAEDYAQLDGLTTFYKPDDTTAIADHISKFLADQKVNMNEIDLVIIGKNGDVKNDAIYDSLKDSVFNNKETINYKHLCGEYPTSSSFALWLAANIIKKGEVPAAIGQEISKTNQLKRILIYNNYLNIYHSLLLISAC